MTKTTRADEVLNVLRQAGSRGVTTSEMLDSTSHRYSAYILRLRRRGHVIETTKEQDGSWRYKLVQEAAAAPAAPPAEVTQLKSKPEPIAQSADDQTALFTLPKHPYQWAA